MPHVSELGLELMVLGFEPMPLPTAHPDMAEYWTYRTYGEGWGILHVEVYRRFPYAPLRYEVGLSGRRRLWTYDKATVHRKVLKIIEERESEKNI